MQGSQEDAMAHGPGPAWGPVYPSLQPHGFSEGFFNIFLLLLFPLNAEMQLAGNLLLVPLLLGTAVLGNPDSWLQTGLHQEGGTRLVGKLGLNRSWRVSGELKMPDMRWSPGHQCFRLHGKTISCCQVELGPVGSPNS